MHGQTMLNSEDNQGPSEPDTQDKAEQLDRILRSRALQNSESLKALLHYIASRVIEGKDSQIKEYTIAVEVFGRGKDFNASIDSLVRVQAKRLREKLKEYYQTEGKSDKVVIDIPKGRYNTVFSYSHQEEPAPAADIASEQLPSTVATVRTASISRGALLRNTLLWLIAFLVIVCALLYYWNRALRRQAFPRAVRTAGADHGSVWEPFTSSNSPTLVILSNPPLFRFSNASDPQAVIKNAVDMTPEECSRAAETLKDRFVVKQPGKLRLVFAPREYTGIGEAIGLYRVTGLLRAAGTTVTFKQSRTVSAEDLKTNNVVMLGSVWANVWSGKIPVQEDLTYTINATIHNNNPLAGEQSEYRPKFNEQTGQLVEDYALITVRPGVTDENTVMVLAGIESEGTQAAAELVTSEQSLTSLYQRLQQVTGEGSSPKYYQALLKVDVDNGIPTTVSVLTIHPLKAARN
jgi:hypothetical protein